MKITPKMLHLPPYLSTSWSQVRALYVKEANLIVTLIDGTAITIPDLDHSLIEAIFAAHSAFLETQSLPSKDRGVPFQILQGTTAPSMSEGALRFSFDNLDSLNSALHHNQAQAHLPDLPKDIVNKIAAIAKVVAPDEIQNMPKPEPHCNCMHCQIARAIHQFEPQEEKQEEKREEDVKEEQISDEELIFQPWDIIQTGDKLYSVINRLDPQEKYSVYLGHPIGCTCGKQGCEHILAVLKS